jgi:hypothetical protein
MGFMNAAFGLRLVAFFADFLLAAFFFVAIRYSLQNSLGTVIKKSTTVCALRMLQRQRLVNGRASTFGAIFTLRIGASPARELGRAGAISFRRV